MSENQICTFRLKGVLNRRMIGGNWNVDEEVNPSSSTSNGLNRKTHINLQKQCQICSAKAREKNWVSAVLIFLTARNLSSKDGRMAMWQRRHQHLHTLISHYPRRKNGGWEQLRFIYR